MNWADFLHADANLTKVKITLIISECIDEFTVACFLHTQYIFRKFKSYLISHWVGKIKYGCGLSGHGTLKSAVLQEWIDEWSWFLHAHSLSGKLKVKLIVIGST